MKRDLCKTAEKRDSLAALTDWKRYVDVIHSLDYQHQLWSRYQKSFRYAGQIGFEEYVEVVAIVLNRLELEYVDRNVTDVRL